MVLLFFFGCALSVGQAAQQNQNDSGLVRAPVFAIDMGPHAGQAHQLVVTPDERFVITASNDKSIRIWDVKTGELVRRFFVPVRGADDGRLHTLALAPDGDRLAVGGKLQDFGPGRAVIVLSLKDGSVIRSITGFRDITSSVAWSPDGKFLAVGTDGGKRPSDVHVYSSSDWTKVFADQNVEGRVSTIAFRHDNHFFATTNNGKQNSEVVLYRPDDAGFVRVASKNLGRRNGWRAAWTADGTHLYVGGHSYFDGDSLREPSWLQGMGRGRKPPAAEGFVNLRESPDGKRLYGVSRSRSGEARAVLRRWSDRSPGSWHEDLELPEGTVADFAVLKDGRVVFVAEDGAVGAVSADFKLAWRQARTGHRLTGVPEALKVSPDGQWVAFPVDDGKTVREVAFNVMRPRYLPVSAIKADWQSPLTGTKDVSVLSWQGTRNGSVNGVNFPQRRGTERSLSVAVHSRDPVLVLGSAQGGLRKLSAEGKTMWERWIGSDVVAVNLIEAKGLVVAMTKDGYLRLFRLSDGATVMSFYLLPADRKWLAVADTGHYEAGIGAEELAGWIISRGRQQMADFVPLSRFRADYRLPGMVGAVWDSGDQISGIRAAQAALGKPAEQRKPEPVATVVPEDDEDYEDAESGLAVAMDAGAVQRMPPVVSLRSGYEVTVSEPKVTLRFSVNTPEGAPVTQVISRVVSGAAVTRGLRPAVVAGAAEQEITVDLPKEDAEVQLMAENAWGTSTPVSIRVRYVGAKVATVPDRGTLHIIAVGISAYDNPDYRLGLAAKDAQDFAQTLGKQEGRMYSAVDLTLLTDKTAAKPAVEKALADLKARVKPVDTTVLFLAGHGINNASGEYVFLPWDARVEQLGATGVSFHLIRRSLASLPGRTLMFLDTCYSGNALGTARAPSKGDRAGGNRNDNTAAINDLASSENNIIVFASSTGSQVSQEDERWGNGAFTKALVEGLNGQADFSKRGRVTYKQLDAYVADRVDMLTEGQQTPVTPVLQGVPDFVLVEVKG